MIGSVQTAVLSGLTSHAVEVEVKAQNGLPRFCIIGLADSAVREARDRVLAALSQCGFKLPDQILVSLAPAELKKEGSGIDVAIALGVLAAAGIIDSESLRGLVFLGELGLSGEIKKVRGAISHAALAESQSARAIVVPTENFLEASLLPGITVIPADSLKLLVEWLCGNESRPSGKTFSHNEEVQKATSTTFNQVVGQDTAKQALVVAAAGGHNALMIGPPGCGKTMLAETFGGLLPPLTKSEMLAAASIHSIAGLPVGEILKGVRPYRAPHYGMSEAGLVGGGSSLRPGEASLAHCGVLFLDELPEFRRDVIEAIRVPLESGVLRIARAKGAVVIPSRFQLIAAMNPCPCGRLGTKRGGCSCAPHAIQAYLRRLSLPILDRIDLHIALEPVALSDLVSASSPRSVAADESYQERVATARSVQIDRQGVLNAELSGAHALGLINQNSEASKLIGRITDTFRVSARGYTRLLKVARTISDLRGSNAIEAQDIAEAFGFRNTHILESFNPGALYQN